MMQPTGGAQPVSNWGTTIGGLLSQAVNAYGEYEAIKAAKNSSGQGRLEQSYLPEYENGAAVQVEAPKQTATQQPQEPMIFGVPQKTVLMGSVGLLLVALLLKGK
ncbi:hypothetical protein FIU82_07585 [Pseudoalteromonas sp. THAF3]|uniref:hypothetical protein n=1 Tax=Pseudoalteromonas sp. THAF3 TaxID=2587843 RepID=UPI001267E3B1|nr:hypothetical protein [Pseudoalteromonas sp. THAF3]QFU04874.1 hypothetical protein FIU82_07585 [Pseudoalteromonas sp. THAF3]